MSNQSGLLFSPLSGRVSWGRHNGKGIAVGDNQKDVTNEFIQIMELKFPINTAQNISVNGENKYRVIVVDMDKEVAINGKVINAIPIVAKDRIND
jgi:hypothetical protein